ncbi:Oidioi.mRNA.OKI2018_I69.PAR.g13078.t1.cds [Oikopleura dioica]|uniref:Oidioi.mRNA.OKI2018_I69.PAR.g13078.t1.cds n=1 Tax=Oikopleura dioica TaxID=34765 RepID=A0ABN7S720_OIKDI|nr:Oidioi.mRNA.OKI2018_I69.PAR.g13078.t1.cds [Oikopleura dioica]
MSTDRNTLNLYDVIHQFNTQMLQFHNKTRKLAIRIDELLRLETDREAGLRAIRGLADGIDKDFEAAAIFEQILSGSDDEISVDESDSSESDYDDSDDETYTPSTPPQTRGNVRSRPTPVKPSNSRERQANYGCKRKLEFSSDEQPAKRHNSAGSMSHVESETQDIFDSLEDSQSGFRPISPNAAGPSHEYPQSQKWQLRSPMIDLKDRVSPISSSKSSPEKGRASQKSEAMEIVTSVIDFNKDSEATDNSIIDLTVDSPQQEEMRVDGPPEIIDLTIDDFENDSEFEELAIRNNEEFEREEMRQIVSEYEGITSPARSDTIIHARLTPYLLSESDDEPSDNSVVSYDDGYNGIRGQYLSPEEAELLFDREIEDLYEILGVTYEDPPAALSP